MPLHRKPDVCFDNKNTKSFQFTDNTFTLKLNEIYDKVFYNCATKQLNSSTVLTVDTDRNSSKAVVGYVVLKDITNVENLVIVPASGVEIIWLSGDGTVETGKNYIIQFRQISPSKILASLTNTTLSSGEYEPKPHELKYGVLLELETQQGETVYYTDPSDNVDLSNVELYWDYDPETDTLGSATRDNSKVYDEAGTHWLVVMSDTDLKFPFHEKSLITTKLDISRELTKINEYKSCIPLLVRNTNSGFYFIDYILLREINTDGIFDANITNFKNCFDGVIEKVHENLFAQNVNATNFEKTFSKCYFLKEIPENLFAQNVNASVNSFKNTFETCTSITKSVPRLWTVYPGSETNNCFINCTNAANYNDIPENWGGPARSKQITAIYFELPQEGTLLRRLFYWYNNFKNSGETPSGASYHNERVDFYIPQLINGNISWNVFNNYTIENILIKVPVQNIENFAFLNAINAGFKPFFNLYINYQSRKFINGEFLTVNYPIIWDKNDTLNVNGKISLTDSMLYDWQDPDNEQGGSRLRILINSTLFIDIGAECDAYDNWEAIGGIYKIMFPDGHKEQSGPIHNLVSADVNNKIYWNIGFNIDANVYVLYGSPNRYGGAIKFEGNTATLSNNAQYAPYGDMSLNYVKFDTTA